MKLNISNIKLKINCCKKIVNKTVSTDKTDSTITTKDSCFYKIFYCCLCENETEDKQPKTIDKLVK